jgi:hypothetical protein
VPHECATTVGSASLPDSIELLYLDEVIAACALFPERTGYSGTWHYLPLLQQRPGAFNTPSRCAAAQAVAQCMSSSNQSGRANQRARCEFLEILAAPGTPEKQVEQAIEMARLGPT